MLNANFQKNKYFKFSRFEFKITMEEIFLIFHLINRFYL